MKKLKTFALTTLLATGIFVSSSTLAAGFSTTNTNPQIDLAISGDVSLTNFGLEYPQKYFYNEWVWGADFAFQGVSSIFQNQLIDFSMGGELGLGKSGVVDTIEYNYQHLPLVNSNYNYFIGTLGKLTFGDIRNSALTVAAGIGYEFNYTTRLGKDIRFVDVDDNRSWITGFYLNAYAGVRFNRNYELGVNYSVSPSTLDGKNFNTSMIKFVLTYHYK